MVVLNLVKLDGKWLLIKSAPRATVVGSNLTIATDKKACRFQKFAGFCGQVSGFGLVLTGAYPVSKTLFKEKYNFRVTTYGQRRLGLKRFEKLNRRFVNSGDAYEGKDLDFIDSFGFGYFRLFYFLQIK